MDDIFLDGLEMLFDGCKLLGKRVFLFLVLVQFRVEDDNL